MHSDDQAEHEFLSVLSLEPLLDFWRAHVAPKCQDLAKMFELFERNILDNPELNGDIDDPGVIEQYEEEIVPLMAAVFPASSWESDLAGAVTPLANQPFYYTPRFGRQFLSADGAIRGSLKKPEQDILQFHQLRAYWLILDKVYGIGQGRNIPVIRTVTDPESGLERYYQMLPDWQFLRVQTQRAPIPLSPEQKSLISENIDNPEALARLIPPQQFEFRGFIVIRAVDVTQSEVLADLERGVIDQETIFCNDGLVASSSACEPFSGGRSCAPDWAPCMGIRCGLSPMRRTLPLTVSSKTPTTSL